MDVNKALVPVISLKSIKILNAQQLVLNLLKFKKNKLKSRL